jgi:hypothetical protein
MARNAVESGSDCICGLPTNVYEFIYVIAFRDYNKISRNSIALRSQQNEEVVCFAYGKTAISFIITSGG